jgi:CRP-like cAMP-binding protein
VTDADLRRFPLFAALDEAELKLVAFLLEERELTAEQPVWREGDAAEGLWLLDQGTLRFETKSEGTLGHGAAPAWFGAASLVGESGPREASAYAAGSARALVLSRTAFAQLLEAAPRTAARVLAAIAAELGAVLRDGVPFLAAQR